MENRKYGEIYILTSPSGRHYVGQALKYVLEKGKLKKHGTLGRWKTHIQEANRSVTTRQCRALNRAIKKYGSESFKVQKIRTCLIEELDDKESYYIKKYNALSPNGYNLTTGGKQCRMSKETCEKISQIVTKYFSDPENRRKQSEIQKAITYRADYTRKNTEKKDLPKYVYLVRRNDVVGGRSGYSVKHYRTGQRKYFTSGSLTMNEKYEMAINYLNSIQQMDNPQPSS